MTYESTCNKRRRKQESYQLTDSYESIVNQAMRATDEKPQFLKRPESKQKMLDLQELALSSSKYYSTKGFIKEAVGYYFPNE